MTQTNSEEISARGRRTAVALFAVLAFAAGAALAVDKVAHENRTDLRIKDMHAKLNITPAQEAQWAKVANAMRDNAKTMDALTHARDKHAKDMSAVDDLNSYGEIADANAIGIHKFVPRFAALYAGMSDAQKKAADTLFRHGEDGHH